MPLLPLDFNTLINRAATRLQDNTVLTNAASGTQLRALLETIYSDLSSLQADFLLNQTRSFINGATGSELDQIASLFGIQRRQATTFYVTADAKAFKFYTNAVNFGAINSGSNIVIPAGTKIFSSSDVTIRYTITDNVILSSSSNIGYCNALGDINGSASNISGIGLIDSHDFTNYVDNKNNSLLISNNFPITTALDNETDAELRYRIINQAQTLQKCNVLALRFTILQMPGVVDVFYEDKAYGIGTGRMIVQGTTPITSQVILDVAQALLDTQAPIGTKIFAERPDVVELALSVTINFRSGTSATDQEKITNNVYSVIVNHINNIPLNEPFIINRLASDIINVDSNKILSIGQPNKFFNYIYAFRTTKIGQVKNELTTDYFIPPGSNYKFTVATTVTNPILVL